MMMTTGSAISVGPATNPHELWQAQRLVAAGYAALGRPPLDVGDVYTEFYPPASSPSQQRVHTLVARDDGHLVATMALIRAEYGATACHYEHVEALRLLRSPRPWAETLGHPPHRIAEITRFAIGREYQGLRRPDVKPAMFGALLRLTLDLAHAHDVELVLAIMPPAVSRLVAGASIAMGVIADVALAEDDPSCMALYRRYPRYWLPDHPRHVPRLYVIGSDRV